MGKSAPLALPYNIMQWLRRHEEYEMKHWSIHDLRKTARTNFSTLTEPHIAEIMLGHKLPGRGRSMTITTMSPNRPRHTARGANALRNSLPRRTSDLWLAEVNRGYRPRSRRRPTSRVRRTHPRVLRTEPSASPSHETALEEASSPISCSTKTGPSYLQIPFPGTQASSRRRNSRICCSIGGVSSPPRALGKEDVHKRR
jgi:hypothetical protein